MELEKYNIEATNLKKYITNSDLANLTIDNAVDIYGKQYTKE